MQAELRRLQAECQVHSERAAGAAADTARLEAALEASEAGASKAGAAAAAGRQRARVLEQQLVALR
jgi:hypothetical protein